MAAGFPTGFLLVLACTAAFAWIVAIVHENGIRPTRNLAAFFKSQPRIGRFVIGTLFASLWVFASVKPGSYTSLQTRVGVGCDFSANPVGRDVPVAPQSASDGDSSADSDAAQSAAVRPQGLALRGGLAAQNITPTNATIGAVQDGASTNAMLGASTGAAPTNVLVGASFGGGA